MRGSTRQRMCGSTLQLGCIGPNEAVTTPSRLYFLKWNSVSDCNDLSTNQRRLVITIIAWMDFVSKIQQYLLILEWWR